MPPRIKARILRWGNILIYSLCAALVYAYPAQYLRVELQEHFLEWFGDAFLAGGGLCAISALVLLWFIHFSGARPKHFRHAVWLSYPTFLTSVVLGCWLAPFISGIPTGTLQTDPLPFLPAFSTSILFILLCLLYAHGRQNLRNWLKSEPVAPTELAAASLAEEKISDEVLLAWLRREEPVQELHNDLFNRRFIAERLLRRLDDKENTIALQGDYGSGKSSVVMMAKKIAEKENKPLIFVQVSCWGFESGAKAQEEVLNQLLRELGEVLDCFAIRNIPARYLEAMTDHGGWLKSVVKLGSGSKTPLEQLQQISPLLSAIRHRVVIFIEDVDRNGSSFDISLIQALLSQFRVVRDLSFVLSISPNQHVDFMKLCEFVEVLPKLEDQQILTIINQVRECMLRKHSALVFVDPPDELSISRHAYENLHSSIGYAFAWPMILCALLHSPRHLKHSLRRAHEAWTKLHGEVNIDDLIGISVLRTVAPTAFSFYTAKKHLFPRIPDDMPFEKEVVETPILKNLRTEWASICESADFDSLNIAWLLVKLDARSCKIFKVKDFSSPKKQSISDSKRGLVYFRRLVNEAADQEDVSDQSILELLKSVSSDVDAIKQLARKITESQTASDTFEQFASALDFDPHLLPLLTEIHAALREHHETNTDAGFLAASHLVKNQMAYKGITPPQFEEWLMQECVRCIPGHMNLLVMIYTCWRAQGMLKKMCEPTTKSLKKEWTNISPKQMARGFTSDSPDTLSYLLFIDGSSAIDWKWLGPVLRRAMREEAQIMLPQVVYALSENPLVISSSNPYRLNEQTLSAWFPRHKREVISLIAEGFPINQSLDVWTKTWLESGISKAEEWLRVHKK